MAEPNDKTKRVSQRRKNKKKMNAVKMASIILVGVVLLYLSAAVFVSFNSNLSTTVAKSGSVRETVRTVGYVFRQQTVLNSPGGVLECIVSEGERVKEGQTLGYVYAERPDPVLMDRIRNLHSIITSRGIDTENSVYTSSPATAENRISVLSRELSDMRADSDLSRIVDIKDEIDALILRKQDIDENRISNASTEQLEIELSSLLAQAGSGTKVVATAGGVFTTRIDGLEDELAYDLAMTVTPDYINELNQTELKEAEKTAAGEPLCKIVNNYNWYFATEINEEDVEHIREGQTIQLEFFDLTDTAISGRVNRISEAQDGKRAVVISTNKYVEGIYSSSRIDADIVLVSSSGIKLPTQCLHVKDGVTGVYVIRLDVARFVPVNIIYKNEDWTIVSSGEPEQGGVRLQIYDEVIVSCRNLEDGKIIR